MKPFTFVHASDLHLDSPCQGITAESAEIKDYFRNSTFTAYENLINLCIREKAQFLLIAGDVYDGADRSLRAQLRFRDGLARLAEHTIPALVVHGNHDPLDGWSASIHWPPGVHIFGGDRVETVIWEQDGAPRASISGISYRRRETRQNLAAGFAAPDQELFNIGLLHCNVGTETGHEPYAPCSLADLAKSGMDYWALGHVHQHAILRENPWVVYPGNIQGLQVNEFGARGCCLVRVDERRRAEVSFQNLDAVRRLSADLCIDSVPSIDGLEGLLREQVSLLREKNPGPALILTLTLRGRGPLYRDLKREETVPALLERLRQHETGIHPPLWVEEIKMRCQPEINREERMRGPDFVGQVLRFSQDLRQTPGLLEQALTESLGDFFQNRKAGCFIDPPSETEARELLAEAERYCLDHLEE